MKYNDLEQKYKEYFDEFLYEELLDFNKSLFECDSIYIELDIEFIFETKHKYSEDGEKFLFEYKEFVGVEISNYYIELRDYDDVVSSFKYQSEDDEKESIIEAIEQASARLFREFPQLIK